MGFEVAGARAIAQQFEQRAVLVTELVAGVRACGRRVWTVAPESTPGPAAAGVANSPWAGFWVVSPSTLAAVSPDGCSGAENVLASAAVALGRLGPSTVSLAR